MNLNWFRLKTELIRDLKAWRPTPNESANFWQITRQTFTFLKFWHLSGSKIGAGTI